MSFVKAVSDELIDFMIALLRTGFRNTKIQSWRVTGKIYSLVMRIRTESKKNKDFLVVFREAKLFCESGDITILPTLISGEYENIEINRLLEFASMREKRFKLIDVGANIGIYSVLFAKEMNRDSDTQFFLEKQSGTKEELRETTVFAFEPEPRNLARLYRNIQLNIEAPELIFVSQLGISDKQGRLQFKSSKYGGTSGIDILEYDSNIEIEVTTIDKFCEDKIGSTENLILKIDVEGHESSVLRGALGIIRANRPIIFVEVSPHSSNLEIDLMNEILIFYNRAEFVYGNKTQYFEFISSDQLQEFNEYGNLILYNE
jgi:FkbM family methyltransferase